MCLYICISNTAFKMLNLCINRLWGTSACTITHLIISLEDKQCWHHGVIPKRWWRFYLFPTDKLSVFTRTMREKYVILHSLLITDFDLDVFPDDLHNLSHSVLLGKSPWIQLFTREYTPKALLMLFEIARPL